MMNKVVCASVVALLVSSMVLLNLPWPDPVHHRVISASPTLLNGRRWVLDVHQHNSKRESVVKASIQAELLSSGIFWPTFTVSIMKDPWCSKHHTGVSAANEKLIPYWMQTPVISGQFGSFAGGSKLNLSVPLGVDLSGHDLCVVVTNNRAENSNSIAVENAAKANIVVNYDVISHNKDMLGVIFHNKLLATFFSIFVSSLLLLFGHLMSTLFASVIEKNQSFKSLAAHFLNPARHEDSKKKSGWRRRRQRHRSSTHANSQMEERRASNTVPDPPNMDLTANGPQLGILKTDHLDVAAIHPISNDVGNQSNSVIDDAGTASSSVSSMNSATETTPSQITAHLFEVTEGDNEPMDHSPDNESNEERDISSERNATGGTECDEDMARSSDADYEIISAT